MIEETEDAYVIAAPSLVVTSCRREPWSWRLELRSDDVSWTVIIGGTCSLTQPSGESSVDGAESLACLLGKSVSTLRGRKSDGELEITFSDGVVLRIDPDVDHEAWEMYSTRGERLIAVPGDGIATWGELRRESLISTPARRPDEEG